MKEVREINIDCFLISNGQHKQAYISEEMLIELTKTLRTNGKEWVHFKDNSIEVEGVYIPAKGSKTSLMLFLSEE